MLLTYGLLGTALTKNAKVAFNKGVKLAPQAGRMMFDVRSVTDKISESDSWSFDPIARATGEGSNYASDDPVKGYNLILTQAKFTQSFEMTKESGMYDKYNVTTALRGVQGLGTACGKRFEMDAQLLVGQGSGASYTDMDGQTISTLSADSVNVFSASHTTRSGTGYGNLGSSVFGQTGLEADEVLWRSFVNHDGEQVDKISTHIYTTRKSGVTNLVDEYRNARGHVEDDALGINVFNTNFNRAAGPRYGHIVMEYLDASSTGGIDTAKDDYWGTVQAGAAEMEAKISQNPMVYPIQLVQRNRNVLVQTDMHYAYGIKDAFCITQHNA